MKLPHTTYPLNQIRTFKGERIKFLGTSFIENGQEIVHVQRIEKEGFHEAALQIAAWESLAIEPQ
jgi:hypothetical protein